MASFLPRVEASQAFAMTSPAERAYARWLAQERYSGQGALVELGCWLGSMSRELVRGLADNARCPPARARLRVFDLFRWTVIMEDFARGTPVAGRYQPGDDYQDLYRERMAGLMARIDLSQADLASHHWNGGPIEILLVDVMKTAQLTRQISNSFFPSLLPGRGLIAHQDYLHFGHPWIHIGTFLLAASLEPYQVVPASCMAVFRVTRAIAPLAGFPATVDAFTEEQIRAAYAWNRRHLPESLHDTLASAEVHLRLQRGEHERARQLYWDYSRGPYAGSASFREMYRFNKRFGFIDFDDERMA
jgi:hypothetical protein